MSIDHNKKEKGQEQPLPAETLPDQTTFPAPFSPSHPKHRRRLVAIISTTAIVLLLSASVGAVVLMQQGRQSATPTSHPTATATAPTTTTPTTTTPTTATPTTPAQGQWVQVLSDYRVTYLTAAPGHPNVLYACGIPSGPPDDTAGIQTVLRSEDFGTHWQDIGSGAQIGGACALTINPANSNEIYVNTAPPNSTVVFYVLKHTSDGGNTWETIHPTISVPGLNTPPDWQAGPLSFAGNHLYSLQALPTPPTPTPQGPPLTLLTRLLTSADGGHTWNVLDTQFAATGQSAAEYAVNAANPTVIYELAGFSGIPGGPLPQLTLYKSVDGGKTWQSLLQPITPQGMAMVKILLGDDNPNLIYLTGMGCPTSQTAPTSGGPLVQQGGGSFTYCASRDGGKSWSTMVSPDQLYSTGERLIDQQGRLYAEGVLSGSVQDIWRYDPTSDTWSKVAQTPLEGYMVASTSTGANDTTALWFMNATGQPVLYRYLL